VTQRDSLMRLAPPGYHPQRLGGPGESKAIPEGGGHRLTLRIDDVVVQRVTIKLRCSLASLVAWPTSI
jgi:hypothetical protein